MEDEEDVTTNPVFITLKQKYPSLYQLVQTKCYIVCVPQTASIAETISEEFLSTPHILPLPCMREDLTMCCMFRAPAFIIELHILSESPYFQGTYLTLCDKSVEIENNEITTTQGWLPSRCRLVGCCRNQAKNNIFPLWTQALKSSERSRFSPRSFSTMHSRRASEFCSSSDISRAAPRFLICLLNSLPNPCSCLPL